MSGGTGYWNYGMNYAMRYLLSWENATGKKHPAFKIKELGTSLFFPLDFTGITFGDNDGWGPCCFYFMLASRMNQPHAALNAATYLNERAERMRKKHGARAATGDLLYCADFIPTTAEMARLEQSHRRTKVPLARVYKGLGWAALADDEAFPTLRMAVRGGSSQISGHGMLDLLSFRCRVNGELMITDQPDGGYMPTTFTRRGHEIYGRSAESKSTLFVDGLACDINMTCDATEVVRAGDLLGIRIDGSHTFLPRWKDLFIGRLVLMVENSYWLVIDHLLSPREVDQHWIESRFHTLAENESGKNWVSLKSGKERMTMTLASLSGSQMQVSRGMPSQANVPQSTIYRWMSAAGSNDPFHVSALNPGSKKLGLALSKEKGDVYVIAVTKPGGKTRRIRLTASLQLK